ncbi:MAG: entericidin A/B family lipoprotein [Neisseria sp.]|nr:entericidin A/B family lipoprotein [Neisseria sp.]MDO4641161.1 entericidin A/B family lipoprotein [Neisseria sp.]
MKKLTLIALAALSLLSACNTVSGFGKDVSHVGNNLEQSADRHR